MEGCQESLACVHDELTADRRRDRKARRVMRQISRDLAALAERPAEPGRDHGQSFREGLRDVQERIEDLRAEMTAERRRTDARTTAALKQLRNHFDRVSDLSVLGELSASVAHEIRNPLCGIRLSAEVLQTKMDPDDSRMTLLANLQREAEKMAKIVNNLLHFSRQYKPRLACCDMADVVAKSVESVRHRLRKKDLKVHVHGADAAFHAHADADLLQQVFSNLLANAADACAPQNAIDVDIAAGAEPDRIAVTVRDAGEGIAPEQIDRVFDPFYTSKANGVGLGLSVTKKIVEAHGGRIYVVSRLGKGTVFTVLLPCQAQPAPVEVAA